MVDSFYEYLIKAYILRGQQEKRLARMYTSSVKALDKYMTASPSNFTDVLFLADLVEGKQSWEMDELACFAPANLLLSARVLKSNSMETLATRLMDGCYHAWKSTPTGIAPESWYYVDSKTGKTTVEHLDDVEKKQAQDWGFFSKSSRYILRPETVESLFYFYRYTGDKKYQDWGWNIFKSLQKHCRAPYGYSGLEDVTLEHGHNWDNIQESFFFAETLKYLYLLFEEDTSILDLSQWSSPVIVPCQYSMYCSRCLRLASARSVSLLRNQAPDKPVIYHGRQNFICTSLKQKFDISTPTQTQAQVLDHVFAGKDVLVRDAPGTGKSFGLAVGLLSLPRTSSSSPTTLLVVPNRELALQIKGWIERLVPSSMDIDDIVQSLVSDTDVLAFQNSPLTRIPPHILIGTPNQLLRIIDGLDLSELSNVVVDEADQALRLPRRFATTREIRNRQRHPKSTELLLDRILNTGRHPRMIMCSATLNHGFRDFVIRQKAWVSKDAVFVDGSSGITNMSNIKHQCLIVSAQHIRNLRPHRVHEDEPSANLDESDEATFSSVDRFADDDDRMLSSVAQLCDVERITKAIVFINNNVSLQDLQERFSGHGINASQLFDIISHPTILSTSHPQLLLATEFTSRGVDLPDISHVFILGIPKSIASYLHMAGRTGRFGRQGTVITLVREQGQAEARMRDIETLGELEARHRKELKELQGKIVGLKKSAGNDKKRKKEVQVEIARLEAEIDQRHEAEKAACIARQGDKAAEATENQEETLPDVDTSNINDDTTHSTPQSTGGPKKNKAKARQQRRKAELQRMQDEAAQEAEGQVDMQALEKKAIIDLVAAKGLQVKDITADGHCLYNAISDQLNVRQGKQISYQKLREQTAQYMREHRDEFFPFMETDDGGIMTEDAYEKYCSDIEKTPRWGGQLEILAISKVHQVPVHIVQMGSPMIRISEEEFKDAKPITVSYHKYMYGLGAHYNSLRDK
ncbi:hypothetical protein BZG36_00038 [Bifiguratus adelaidae]|uniref:alpha-1,2-Mannosidase n=1 Tax=Bifiguratus adelaidae TaxID=1938954 RepID=A0A261Y8U0_9FUNG|nr:hypothetical protein BZG36_00038 [Bifiguratus adelaidae]